MKKVDHRKTQAEIKLVKLRHRILDSKLKLALTRWLRR